MLLWTILDIFLMEPTTLILGEAIHIPKDEIFFEPKMGNLLESLEPLLVHCIIVSKVVEPESHQIRLYIFFKLSKLCNVTLV